MVELQYVVTYHPLAVGDVFFRNTPLIIGRQEWPDACCSSQQYGRRSSPIRGGSNRQEDRVITILLVIVVLMLLGAVPAWPHSRNWGYAPSGTLGLILIILLVLVLTGRM
jgi:hypothetical protein